jgi:hypothetical protein
MGESRHPSTIEGSDHWTRQHPRWQRIVNAELKVAARWVVLMVE